MSIALSGQAHTNGPYELRLGISASDLVEVVDVLEGVTTTSSVTKTIIEAFRIMREWVEPSDRKFLPNFFRSDFFCVDNSIEPMDELFWPEIFRLEKFRAKEEEPESEPVHNFEWALYWLKEGKRVTREGWSGKGMWLALQMPDENSKMTLPYIYIEYPEGHVAYPNGSRVPWLASQTDMLGTDWMLLE